MTSAVHDAVPWRVQLAVYGVGLFSTSLFFIGSVIIPLKAYALNPSPFMFGLVFSIGHVLPLLLSIHGGSLMDQFGARRVLLYSTTAGAIVPLLYPLATTIWMLLALQMLLGLCQSMGWLGAQTMIGQYMKGRTSYAGRLSAAIRIGQLAGPPMVGVAWDVSGPWGAFAMMSLWAWGAAISAFVLPPPPGNATAGTASTPGETPKRNVMPRLSDYLTAFRLLRMPAVALILLLGTMLHLGNSVQSSFYVAWLTEMGITGTAIGLLSPIGAVGAAAFSLVTARLTKYVGGFWIVLFSLWAGVLLVCITPLLGSYFLLQIAMFLRSGANGLAQPLVITLALRGAGNENQGKAIGLRGTANRIASIISPLLMGVIAEAVGLEASFYVMAAIVSVFMIAIAIYLIRRPELARSGED